MLRALQSVSLRRFWITATFTIVVSLFLLSDPPHLMPKPAEGVTVSTVMPTTTTSTTLVPASIMKQWEKVGWCETHLNWHRVYWGAHAFSGALGIRNDVWLAHGGAEFGPTAGHGTPEQQVIVARRIQARGGVPNYVPDQSGCNGSW